MAEITVITREWGNSIGVTLPSEVVREKNIVPNQKLKIEIKDMPKKPAHDSFGLLRGWKINTQKLKERLREESDW